MNIYLFDLFDTIVHRDIHPDTVKQIWANVVSEMINELSARRIYEIRIDSEVYVGKKYGEYTYDLICDEIVRRIINEGINICDPDNFIKNLIEIEIKIEKKHLFIDNDIIDEIKNIKSKKEKVYIVSDFYFGSEVIKDFLEYLSVYDLFDGIFVSCDYGCSKAEGKLYDIVIRECNISKNDICMMIGDNKKSDYRNAIQKGIKSRLKINSYLPEIKKYESIRQELKAIERINNDSLYNSFAFSLYLFTHKLYVYLKEEGIKDVFFLAREGLFLKKLFDDYQEINHFADISSHYLLVSRRSTYIASLSKLNEEKFSVLFGNSDVKFSCETFLANINFDENEREMIRSILEINHDDFNKVILNFNKSLYYEKLLELPFFQNVYEEKRLNAQNILKKYISQFGVDIYNNGMVVVDVGWKGTMQDNLYKIYNGEVHLKGFYLGLLDLTETLYGNYKYGVLFSNYPCRSTFYGKFSFNHLMYEDVLQASHPSTLCYKEIEGKVVPVFDQKEAEVLFSNAQQIQDKIIKIFQQISSIFVDTVYTPVDFKAVFAEISLRSIRNCSVKDVKKYIDMKSAHYNNFISFLTVKETLDSYSHELIIEKVIRNLMQIKHLFTAEHFMDIASWMIRLHLFCLLFPYREIVYRIEKRRVRN